ncbi:MAG: penicillin-binding protein activator [Rhodothalassiaceae bacterium]|nr:MAG: penicillin-binding protein activator [Rhodothalassiaceae bacterium]
MRSGMEAGILQPSRMTTRLRNRLAGLAVLLLIAGCATGAPRPEPAPAPESARPAPPPARAFPPGGASAPPAFPEEQGAIPVAVLLPLSGEQAETGRALLEAAQSAFFAASDPRLALLVYDTGGSDEEARAAADRAVAAGARAVIGPLLSRTVDAVAPIFVAAGIPVLALTSDSRTARPGVWPLGFAPEADVRRIIGYAAARGYRRLAALLPETAYGERVAAALGRALGGTGMTLVAFQRYLPNAAALDGPVRAIARYEERRRALEQERAVLEELGDDLAREILAELDRRDTLGGPGFDALLIAEGDPLIRSLAPLLAYYDVDASAVRFLGTGLLDDPAVLREPNLVGAWFPAPDPARPRALIAELEKTFSAPFPRIATLAYDAMALIATLAREPDLERRLKPAAFTDPRGFIGVDGPFRLRPDGRVERHLSVLEIGRGGFRVIDPADPHFAPVPVS